ncbi:hypothetical protein PtA15_11A233 [Puccinia triticina]|uniref:Uncharacterized protein n=1 Tax=Puccinia triticina TaxID=208348 RepID=A0ABY7CY31_9BASI|nr:uncharacterized protein PtA15_11A233 [Puccinia triticina]WAQ89544.1 hypothetical protein PtA15_11A233 [Puccinia triticina]
MASQQNSWHQYDCHTVEHRSRNSHQSTSLLQRNHASEKQKDKNKEVRNSMYAESFGNKVEK